MAQERQHLGFVNDPDEGIHYWPKCNTPVPFGSQKKQIVKKLNITK